MSNQGGLPEGNTIGEIQRPIFTAHPGTSQRYISSGSQLKLDPVTESFDSISKSQSPISNQIPTPRSANSSQQLVQHQLQREFMVQQEQFQDVRGQGLSNHDGLIGTDYLPNSMNINSSVTNSEPQEKDYLGGTDMSAIPRKRSRSTNSASLPMQQYNFATHQMHGNAENFTSNNQINSSSVSGSLNTSYTETGRNHQPSTVDMSQSRRRQASGSNSSHPIDLKEYQIQGLDNGTISTNTMAAAAASAAMGSSGGISPQQVQQLRQLQATYGNLQTNINKQQQQRQQQQQFSQSPQQYQAQARPPNQNQNQPQSEYNSPARSITPTVRNNASHRQNFNYQGFVPIQQQHQQQQSAQNQQPQGQYHYQQHQTPQQQVQMSNMPLQGQPFQSQVGNPGIQYVSYQQPGSSTQLNSQQQQQQQQQRPQQSQQSQQGPIGVNTRRYIPAGPQSQGGQAMHQPAFYGPHMHVDGKPQQISSPAQAPQNIQVQGISTRQELVFNSPMAGRPIPASGGPVPLTGYGSIPRGAPVAPNSIASSSSTPITTKPILKTSMNPSMVPGVPATVPTPAPAPVPVVRPLPEDLKRINANAAIIRLFELSEKISVRFGSVNINYWKEIMNEFFDENATISVNVRDHKVTRHYSFSHSILPLLCHAVASHCATALELSQNFIRAEVLANGTILLDCARFVQRWWYPDGSFKTRYGSLRVCFNRRNLIEVMSVSVFKSSWGLEMSPLEKFLNLHPGANSDAIKANFLAFQGNNDLGFHDRTLRIMQIGDVMNLLRPLMYYHLVSGSNSPVNSLEAFNKAVISNNPKADNLPQAQDGHSADQRTNQSVDQQHQQQRPKYSRAGTDLTTGINLDPKSMRVKPTSPSQSTGFRQQNHFQQHMTQQHINAKNVPRNLVHDNIILNQQKLEERRRIIQPVSQNGSGADGAASVNHRVHSMQMKVKAFQPRHNVQQNRISGSAIHTWTVDGPTSGIKKRKAH